MEACNISNCDIYQAINQIKSRYSAVIIIALFKKKKNFTTLSEEFDYLTNTQLTRTLNLLIKYNIIKKENNFYFLTKKGTDLYPILQSLNSWFSNY